MDEYLAKLGLDVGDLLGAIDSVLTYFGKIEAAGGKLDTVLKRVEKASLAAASGLREGAEATAALSRESNDALDSLNKESDAWTALQEKVSAASAAYRLAARDRVTGESSPGAKPLAAFTAPEKQQILDVSDASNANLVRDIRQEQQIRERGAEEMNRALIGLDQQLEARRVAEAQDEARAINALQEQRAARENQIATEALREFEADSQRRIAAKQDEYRAMLALDQQIERAEKAAAEARTSALGGRNYGNASVLNDAAIEQQQRATTKASNDLKAYLIEQNAVAQAAERTGTISLPRLRYGLYDISTFSLMAGTAVAGLGVAVVKTAVDYEKLYAQVQRTSTALTNGNLSANQQRTQYAQLREELVGITQDIPTTFSDITEIATLGNQLGIGSADIAEFSETVAKFSSTTNVGVEDSATAFGRLGQILHDNDYRAIGDDIAYLGVKSVATESDIIGVAQQIAVTTQQAKFSTGATLALADAVASLGVKPEQARGTFIRVFGAIRAAVANGGQALNDIAQVSGTTSEDFRTQWGEDSSGAFQRFVEGIGSGGKDVKASLAELGITAVRDVQTIGLLSQNSKILADANRDVGDSAGYLEKTYSVVAETAAAKIEVLKNNVLALLDAGGRQTTGPLAGLLTALNAALKVATAIVANPISGWATFALASISLLAGGALLLFSVLGRVAANIIAVRTVAEDLGIKTNGLGGAFGNLRRLLNLNTLATNEQTAANERLAASEAAAAGATTEHAAAANLDAGATGKNTTAAGANTVANGTGSATSRLGRALNSAAGTNLLIGGLIGIATFGPGAIDALHQMYLEANGLTPAVDKLGNAMQGLADKSKESAAAALADLEKALPTAEKLRESVGSVLNDPGNALAGASSYTDAQALYDRITKGRARAGGVVDAGGQSPIINPDNLDAQVTQLQNYDQALAKLAGKDPAAASAALQLLEARFKAAGLSNAKINELIPQTVEALGLQEGQTIAAALAAQQLADAETNGADVSAQYLQAVFGGGIAAQKVQSDLTSLGSSIRENGADFALSGQQISDTLADIYAQSNDASTAASQILGLALALEQAGIATTAQLDGIRRYAYLLDPTAKATAVSLDGLAEGLADVDGQGSKASDTLRTVADYANDLNSTLTRAFDLRFGNQEALDSITSKFHDLADAADDSSDKIRKAKADLATLRSDRGGLQQQLQVAEQFGDYAQAAALRAQLAENANSIKDKQADIRDATASSSRALKGNSDAAIDNRAKLLGIIQAGQAYIQSLAQNGATQQTLATKTAGLKQQFIDQATQLGYNKKDVADLALAFDDFSTVVTEMPRQVDVDVNAKTGPAQQALEEFLAKADKKDASVNILGKTDDDQLNEVVNGIAAKLQDALQKALAEDVISRAPLLPGKHTALPGSLTGRFRDGGYTGDAPAWAPTGVVHGQEYVLNATAARMFPRQMLDSANRGVAPQMTKVQAKAVLPSGMTVSLGAVERALMGASGSQHISVSADRFGDAMDDAFRRRNRLGAS